MLDVQSIPIHIGIDFDNTIVDYSQVMREYVKKSKLQADLSNIHVKHIKESMLLRPGGSKHWIKFQGIVYGSLIDKATPARGIKHFLRMCELKSFKVSIISHRSSYPIVGKRVDLRLAAYRWLEKNNFFSDLGISTEDVFFEETRQQKITRITKSHCTHFIDDLEDVFLDLQFPKNIIKILFAPYKQSAKSPKYIQVQNWKAITDLFFYA